MVILVGDIRAWSKQEAGANPHEMRVGDAGWLLGTGTGQLKRTIGTMWGGTGRA
ncbi:MAG TPA: hypothetical protein VF707_02795 [Ardenticatenaceae bacterium]